MRLGGVTFRKILVQRADRLGDVIFTLPVVRWLRTRYPHAEIHFLASPGPAEFLETQGLIDRVIRFESVGFGEIFRVAARLRLESYDLYVSLWNDPKMAILGRLSGIPVRIGDATNRSLAWLYTHTIRQNWECLSVHQVEFNMQLLSPLGWRPEHSWRWHLDVPIGALDSVRDVLQDVNDEDRPVVAFFCGTGGSNLPIPDQTILKTIEVLGDAICPVLVGQVADDSPLRLASLSDGLNRLNQTSISELVAWLSVSDVVVGADTGPIHVAAALGRSIVFCPIRKSNFPTRFGPWTSRVIVLRREYLCTTVPPGFCLDTSCEALPRSEEIVRAVRALIVPGESMGHRHLHTLFLKESIRILVIVNSRVHHHAMVRLARRWRVNGLILIPVIQSRVSIRDTVRQCLRYNATVVVCPEMPVWKAWFIRLIIGAGYQYIPPTVARIRLSVAEDESVFLGWVEDWLTRGERVVI